MGVVRRLIALGGIVAAVAVAWQWNSAVDIEEFYKGKVVIVTGCSRGIGKSLAIRLAQLNAKLVIAARTTDKLLATQQECLKFTADVLAVTADVSKEEDCKAIIDAAVREFGGVDVLILNAAITPEPRWFIELQDPAEEFAHTYSVNLLQSVRLVQLALPHLNASRGIIVPVSSGSGIVSIPKVSPYATSKHALHGFFKSLRQELILSDTPVSISIMPLPYVLTDVAVENWRPIDGGGGITPEDCAERMLVGIPQRKFWYYVDWSMAITGRLYSLFPELIDWYIRHYLHQTSHLFS